jgi:undecaprenyl-phosphate galactose phosphotransferase
MLTLAPCMKPIDTISLPKSTWYTSRRTELQLLILADVLAMLAAFCGAMLWGAAAHGYGIADTRWMSLSIAQGRTQAYIFLILITLTIFRGKGHYTKRKPFANELKDILSIISILAVTDAALLYLTKWQFSRSVMLLNWTLAPVFIVIVRLAMKRTLVQVGGWFRPMVIIGWGENAVETALAFEDEVLMGFTLTAFLIPLGKEKFSHEMVDRFGRQVPCISLGPNPETTLEQLGNPHIVLALEQGGIDTYQEMVLQLGRRNQHMQVVPSLRGLPLYGMEASHFFAHEVLLLTVRNNLARQLPRFVKRCFDLTVSLSILIIGFPFFAAIALKVLGTGRPIFYGHKRVGQDGKIFKCYKFRTMLPDSEKLLADLLANSAEARAEWARDFKLKNDPRITSIGHFLRKTSLDELPQIWNVLIGEMSLVGPRPVVTAELERYGNQVDYYLEAKPGITGLWQISGRNDVTYETRVYLDAWYVKNWSLFNDIVILFRTVKVVFYKDGAY